MILISLNGVEMFGRRTILSVGKPLEFVRYKRTKLGKKGLAANVVKLITQLSVMSASRKQPKLLKLCKEDIIKHEVISKLWSLLQKKQSQSQLENLQKQESLIREAGEELLQVSEPLSRLIGKNHGQRFSLELRIPTRYPPRKLWNYEVKEN